MSAVQDSKTTYTVFLNPVDICDNQDTSQNRFLLYANKVKNTVLMLWHGELYQPLLHNCSNAPWVGEFDTLFTKIHTTYSVEVMNTILKLPRHDTNDGIFELGMGLKAFQKIFSDIFQGATQNDCLLFCEREFVEIHRKVIIGAVNKACSSDNLKIFEDIFEELQTQIKPGEKINIERLCQTYIITVVSKLLLCHPGPTTIYEKLGEAVDFLNRYAMRRSYGIPALWWEKREREKNIEIIRKEIDDNIIKANWNNEDSIVYALLAEDFPLPRIQTILLLILFAGVETSAALLKYTVWALGRDPTLQEPVIKEIKQQKTEEKKLDFQSFTSILNIYKEAIRCFSPAFIIGRSAAVNFEVNVQNKVTKERIFSKLINKGDTILCCPALAARNSVVFKNPHCFDPSRFSIPGENNSISWFPFGYSFHACPGRKLAELEIKLFIGWLIDNFTFASNPEHINFEGFATLKIKENVTAVFTHREKED